MQGSEYAQLKTFIAIVEDGGFSKAANTLGRSRSALSQTVRALEERLGTLLLNRTTRSVALTIEGKKLYADVSAALASIDAAVASLSDRHSTPAGTVRLHTQKLGYRTFVAQHIPSFTQNFPNIELDICISDNPVDIVSAGFDLGLSLGELLDDDMIAVRIGGDLRQIAAASPAYLAKHGTPRSPKSLIDHRSIGFRWKRERDLYQWEFCKDGQWFTVRQHFPIVVNDQQAALDLALAGAGIVFWTEDQIKPWVEQGRLVPLLEQWSATFPGYQLFYPRHHVRPVAIKALVDHLVTRTRQTA